MAEFRRAIHVRTGQRCIVEAVEGWLARGGLVAVAFDDAYAACVHLLRNYSEIPELVLVGADWLSADEFRLVPFIRQTWPQAAIVVYAATADVPLFDYLPLTLSCRGDAAMHKLLAATPEELVRRLRGQMPPVALAPRRAGRLNVRDVAPSFPEPQLVENLSGPAREMTIHSPAQRLADDGVLTAAELSALLEQPPEN